MDTKAMEAAVRDMTKSSTEALGKFGEKIGEYGARLTEVEQTMAQRRRGGLNSPSEMQTAGAHVIASDEFKNFVAGRGRGKISIQVKTITSAAASAGALITPDKKPDPTMLPQQRLTVRNLLAAGTTTSNLIQYPRQTVRTMNAAAVSEGAVKPESVIDFELEDAPVRTIAHWVKASKQAMADAPMLQATIDSELHYGLQLAEEGELLLGDGTSPHLFGIIPQASAFSSPIANPASYNRFDVLLQAIAQSEAALLPATGIVLNDLDLTAMRSIKNAQGDYIASGGPFGPALTSIWGRPTVGTPSMPAGKFLVGAFRDGALLVDRLDAEILISTETDDDFVRNLIRVLCEERVGLCVKRPQAFIYGTFP